MGYDYVADRLSNREINWCPGGEGNLPYCPQPNYPDSYIYCCSITSERGDIPSCCRFPISTGLFVAILICIPILIGLFIALTCWCWPTSPLNKYRSRHRYSTASITTPPRVQFAS